MIGNPLKFAGGVLAALLLSITAVRAACVSPGFNPSNNFCDGCRYEAHMTVTRNEACHRPYRAPQPIEQTDHRMVKRARHGIAVLNGNTIQGPAGCPKGLRHTFGTASLLAKVPIHVVQRWLGHPSIRTTAIYGDVAGAEERQLAAALWKAW